MDFDSCEEYISSSDSSVYGWNSKEALSAIDLTLNEQSRRKNASASSRLNRFIRDQTLHKRVHIDFVGDNMCGNISAMRHRMRQVRFQLAIQKQLVDKGRDRSTERPEICRLKDEAFLSSQLSLHCRTGSSRMVEQLPKSKLPISVPQHFSEKQHQRQKCYGVTAWDGSQYMLSLLFSLSDKLLLKFCFLFLRKRAILWTKKKHLAEVMFENKRRMLVTEAFAGLKINWLQV